MQKQDKALILSASAFILALGALIFILPQREYSTEEKRRLQTLSAPTQGELLSGKYFERVSAFYSDQIPLRRAFTATHALCELALARGECNGVIVFGNELIQRDTASNISAPIKNAVICKIPTKEELFFDGSDALSLYYKTDHHHTTEGAYRVYQALCSELNVAPYPENFFKKESTHAPFYGTAFRRSCLPSFCVNPDAITLYRYEGDTESLVIDRASGEKRRGFYDLNALTGDDKYLVFLGGNYAHLSIHLPQSDGAQRPRMLLIKDSFANSVIPFLALHFDIEALDPRYMTADELKSKIGTLTYDVAVVMGS